MGNSSVWSNLLLGGTVTQVDLLVSVDGNFWDTLLPPVTIPAGASELTVEAISGDVGNCPDDPASLTWIASAFEVEARRAAADGNFDAAQDDYRRALRFDPNLASAHRGLAAALLRGDRDLFGGLGEWFGGIRVVFTDPESVYLLSGNALLVVYLGLCFGTTLALLLLAWRCAPALIHDIEERAGGRLGPSTARILGWLVLAAPLIAPIPPAWTVAVWCALFFAYFRGADRGVAVVALLLLLAAGPVGHLLAWHFGTATDPAARALIESIRAGPDPRHEKALKQVARERPEDPIYPFLLGLAHRQGGHFEDALEMYSRVLEIDSEHARAMINLGNLHALRHEFGVAQSLYKKAAEADSTLALAHYNSHLAYLENFSMEKADEALRQARVVDDRLIAGILAREGDEKTRRTPLDTTYAPGELWGRATSLRLEEGVSHTLAGALMASSTIAGGAGLLAAFILPGIGLTPRSGSARRCRRCGRAFCKRCQVATKYPDYCSQCVHLFILRDGLAPSIRDRKMAEVKHHKRQTFIGARIVSLLFPGGGHVLGGRVVAGTVLLVLRCTTWLRIILDGRLLVLPGNPTMSVGGVVLMPLIIALAVWLTSNLSAQERSRG